MNILEYKNCIEDEIRFYNNQLDEFVVQRAKINKLKKAKDKLVKQYIVDTKAPKILDLELLNYKALLFYFKDNFIKTSLTLKFMNYEKDGKLEDCFIGFFSNGKINIRSEFNNFPHLIGIKNELHISGYMDEFMDSIFYETSLLEDYEKHNLNYKRDIHKIKAFSWIIETLYNPTYVFDKSAIKKKESVNFKSDLIFARMVENCTYNWHIVGLKKLGRNFVIQSNFPIKTKGEFYGKFNLDKKIYERMEGLTGSE
ncbi:hypothetical protein QUF50_08080 [Thiotrichales bacterium HSG1]|nr:hypothetical protein [Thiotrichales bacterium HSG1]